MKRAAPMLAILLLCCTQNDPAPPPAPQQAEREQPAPTPTVTPTATPTATQTRPQQKPQAQTQTQEQEIFIDSVTAANPLVVRGRARTFENNVVLRVRDASGALLVEDHTTSAGEMGQHNPYEAQLWIVRDPGGRVTVEAFEYSARDGSVRSLTSKDVDYRVESVAATLMFPAGDCTRIIPFSRRMPKTKAMARLLVEALLAGPTAAERASGATPPFPRGSDVQSVILRGGVLTVDFNERLRNVGGACAATAIRDSVTRTLARLPAVKEVVITAAGSRELALQP